MTPAAVLTSVVSGRSAIIACLVVMLIVWAGVATGDVRLPLGDWVRPGTYAAVETAAGRVETADGVTLRPRGTGTPAVVPVWITAETGPQWTVVADGREVALTVDTVAGDTRVVVDAAGAGEPAARALAAAVWGDLADVRYVAWTPGAALPAAAVAGVDLWLGPPPADAGLLSAAGVTLAEAAGDAWDVRLPTRERDWAVVDPRVYDAIAGWNPERPARERWWAAGVFAVASTVAWLGLRLGWPAGWLVGVWVAAAAGLTAWHVNRPGVAVQTQTTRGDGWVARQTAVRPWTQRRDDAVARIEFAGVTHPVGYSRGHLRRMRATVVCDVAGNPVELQLTLPPGFAGIIRSVTAD